MGSDVKKAPKTAMSMIRNAMKWCKRKGIGITTGDWGVESDDEEKKFISEGSVCALGALLIKKSGEIEYDPFRGGKPLTEMQVEDAAAEILGVDKNWVACFVSGFDGDDESACNDLLGWDDVKERLTRTSDPVITENRRAFKMGSLLAKQFKL